MIIGPDSPFRRVPSVLDRKQAFFIEGIRVSVEMIELAHQRLQQVLLAITEGIRNNTGPNQTLLTTAVLDAWSFVDSVHRLGDLVEHFPNLQHRSRIPSVRHLSEVNRAINELRNAV
jgi:hypothetical protein